MPDDNAMLALVYEELRRLARERFRGERGDHTLQPTALANEAWLRLTDTLRGRAEAGTPLDAERFRIAAAGAIRRVLVDHARAKQALKRGGKSPSGADAGDRVTLAGLADREGAAPIDLLALDEALEALAAKDARKARVVELRWFGGLSIEETARTLSVNASTVEDDWAFARAWLKRRLEGGA